MVYASGPVAGGSVTQCPAIETRMTMLMAALVWDGEHGAHLVHRKSSLVRRFFRWTYPHPEQLWEV